VTLPPVTFPTLGWQVVDWIETMLVHGPGDIEGDDISVDDEIALFICWLYRLHGPDHPQAGRRLVHRAVLSRPKGRAKSEHAGELVCAEALGPVRFDHWAEPGELSDWGYEYQAGEPVGHPVRSPFIRCLATEEGQAGNTYDNVVVMLSQGAAAERFGLRIGREVGLTRTFLPDGGEIRPSSSGDASKDGGLETFSVADETHLYNSDGLRRMYRTVARNTGKRKEGEPLTLDTTTAWQPGERSIAEQAAERYAHLSTEEAVTRYGVLYDHRQGDEPKRFGDDRSLIKAMRPGYGPAAEWMDFGRIVKIVRDAEDPEAEAYRYWLNRPRAAASHWLAPGEIKAAHEDFDVTPGSPIALGFDGSENDDHTGLVGCTQAGDLFPVGLWTPAGEDLGWRDDVTDAVDWCFRTFTVVRFYADPAYWSHELAAWAAKHGSPPVSEFWTSGRSVGKYGIACGAARTAIRHGDAKISPAPLRTPPRFVANGAVTDGPSGTPLFVWHLENARTYKVRVRVDDTAKTEDAFVVRKARKGSPLKVDGATASVLARRARDDAMKAGEFARPDYGRASWGGETTGGQKKVARTDYLPCVGCGKPIHPKLHAPDAAEQGRCMRCRAKTPTPKRPEEPVAAS
jgi:hypothetical protein